MIKSNYAMIFITAFLFCLVGCERKTKDENIQEKISTAESSLVQENDEPLEMEQESVQEYSIKIPEINLDVVSDNTAHKKFLNDPMQFSEVPDQEIKEGKTAVVGSNVCLFYPKESFAFADENTATIVDEENMNGTSVPISSIVRITGEKLCNAQKDLNSYVQKMFNFQENWNWFYPVEWHGKKGYIYGADLFGLTNSFESNKISAELYRTQGAFTNFYPITGYNSLSKNIISVMEKQKVAFQKTNPEENPYPDDMIDYYCDIDRNIPVFVTTDLISHSQHLIFDRMLQYTEENFFEPRLVSLTNKFIEQLSQSTNAPEEVRTKAIEYFQVPQALLAMASSKTEKDVLVKHGEDETKHIVTYEQKDIAKIFEPYSSNVKADVKQVMDASGTESALFKSTEDFSQYKPRGHYTKNDILKAYFRAEMWYGRIHFLIAQSAIDDSVEEKSLEMLPVALLIIDTVKNNPELYEEWADLFNPITDLIGLSDDLSFADILPLWKAQNVTDFSKWASDKNNVLSFMNLCREQLKPPAISGNTVLYGPSEGGAEHNAPMGWRFLGQRFTYDSYIHDKVSPPRLKGESLETTRSMVTGLDVMKAFGSKSADTLLASTEYEQITGLEKTLDSLEKEFSNYGSDFWNKNYYNEVLYQIKSQADFEQGAGFYFTETPAWNIKALLASHGTWAELRHDTILYSKQSFAEKGGDGDFEPTFRTEPLPKQINYIEPNDSFWKCSILSVQNLQNIYKKFNLLDDETKLTLNRLQELYVKSYEIVIKEINDEAISLEDNKWIRTIPDILCNLVLIHIPASNYFENYDQFKMACIADVFTNSELGECLETGVGVPYRLYVPLNDSQGGKRVAVGYGFTYYEFKQPQNERMTDEEWKQIVYNQYSNMEQYMPFWEKSCFLPLDETL